MDNQWNNSYFLRGNKSCIGLILKLLVWDVKEWEREREVRERKKEKFDVKD